MNLSLEKEKIKKEIDLIDDVRIIKALKKVLADYEADDDVSPSIVSEPPIEDWEMATPLGRTPTPEQLEEWLDKDEGPEMTGEEAFKQIRSELSEWRKEKKKRNASDNT
jgi:hypothetical protein